MFCNQCEETVKGTGCTIKGVCGKEDEIAAYQEGPCSCISARGFP